MSRRMLFAGLVAGFTLATIPSNAEAETTSSNLKPERWSVQWFQKHHRPSAKYWDRVAICESSFDGVNANWQDGGNWSGGLGIARSTWRLYGGYRYAKHAGLATREQQIRIANRIAVKGFIRKDGSFKYPAGFGGWGCIRNRKSLTPPKTALWYEWKYYK